MKSLQIASLLALYNLQIKCVVDIYIVRVFCVQIRVDQLNPQWTSSLMLGVLGYCPDKQSLPNSALGIKKPAWIIHGNSVFHSAVKVAFVYSLMWLTVKAQHHRLKCLI